MKFFNTMTTKVNDSTKRNCVIMGRYTYFGIPEKRRPLANRLNIVLTKQPDTNKFPSDVVLCNSLAEAMEKLTNTEIGNDIENIWICGGYNVYKEAMESKYCHLIYFTEIKAKFECDAFFPEIPENFKLIENHVDVLHDEQEEGGIKYQYKVYEKCN